MSTKADMAIAFHDKGYNCAQAVACSFCREFGIDENSVGEPEKGRLTKGDTYRKVKEYVKKFQKQNGSYLCRELKGVETGKVLRSCPDCIRDAVALTEEYLAAQKQN